MCGAVSGSVIALGYFFGRTVPSTPADPKSVNAIKLAGEVQQNFRDAHQGVLCCHVHLKGLEIGSEEHRTQCEGFTGEMTAKTAEIIARELNIQVRE
jgi:C_GCAxxG_C_C family probable redox protein